MLNACDVYCGHVFIVGAEKIPPALICHLKEPGVLIENCMNQCFISFKPNTKVAPPIGQM